MRKIKINNIKHIQNLEFNVPSQAGVFVLTGSNGSGKTTLLTCLLRIGWYRAFQDFFNTGSDRIDNFEGNITYTVNGQSVTYQYTGERWPPRPRKNSALFSHFGFPEVRFLPATGNRLFINSDNIVPSDFRPVEPALKDDLNDLLETDKFNNLRYVQTGSTRGPGSGSQRWKRAYVIKKGTKYYSEKNFSLGEILILNTLILIADVPDGSLLLIDELEMALHPRVQIKLLKYLESKVQERDLKIILSTHSSSLIKSAKKIIYLENDGAGNIKVNENCYPALILREVAIEEDIHPDYVFIVEDDMAEMLLRETLSFYFQTESNRQVPVYKIIPIGGYQQVLDFAEKSKDYLFNTKTGQYLLPDYDVIDVKSQLQTLGNQRNSNQQALFDQFNQLQNRTIFLHITPELALWNWIISETNSIQTEFQSKFPDATFQLTTLITETNNNFPHDTDSERKKAKRRVKHFVKLIGNRVNEDPVRITRILFNMYVKSFYSNPSNLSTLRATWGSVFNRRGN